MENVPVFGSSGKSNKTTTYIARRECVMATDAGGWLSDNSEGSNKGTYHPGSNNLPNKVAF